MTTAAYLVQYGVDAFVGRFAAEESCERGSAVVVRTPRGVEVGTVLCPADDRFPAAWDADAGGQLLRPANAEDHAAVGRNASLGRELLTTAEADAAELPLTFLDAEVTLDGRAILHALPWGDCEADAACQRWSARFGLSVTLFDVRRSAVAPEPPPAKSGCTSCGTGSGGCSSGGTGKSNCGSGGCSRAVVKTADDLTDYFADLRQKMEAETRSRRPLV